MVEPMCTPIADSGALGGTFSALQYATPLGAPTSSTGWLWDRATWEFINSFAGWLSALGTVAAVIVSLYLATRDARIRLRVRAGIRSILVEGQRGKDAPQFVNVEITNLGRRTATVASIAWVRPFLRRVLMQIPSNNAFTARLPLTLKDGDVGNFFLEMTVVQGAEVRSFKSLVGRLPPWLGIRLIRIAAYTTTGEKFSARIERRLRDEIRKELAKQDFSKPPKAGRT